MSVIRSYTWEEPELNWFIGGREVHLRRYFEPEPGIFIAESRNVIRIALRQGYQPLAAICTEKLTEDGILEELGDIPVFVIDPEIEKERLGYVLTGGIFCAMRRKEPADFREVLRGARRIVVLEDVENPTNVGAIFRSAAAFGMDAVLLSPGCADPFYRRAMRVSVGNALLIPWAYVGYSESDWKARGMELLRQEGFTSMAMALRRETLDLDDPRLKAAEKLAIVMGNEGNGLDTATIDACDYVVKIPMMNGVDSLNVAVASALAMWELGRRR